MKHNQHRRSAWLRKVPNLRVAKRIVVAVIGGTVTLIGIALIVLPGPAFIVIPIGLSILATEFLWAKRWLQKARELATLSKSKLTRDV
jgi:tellurite resistance protein TerC